MAELTREQYQQFHRRRHADMLGLFERHVARRIERALDAGGGGDVAGIGGVVREQYGAELHAIDLDGDVERGRSRGVRAVQCDIDREVMPYKDEHFDLVIFASVIEHLYNPAFALAELARVTRPGGVLIVEAPNAVSLGRRLDAVRGRNPFQRFNLYNALENKARMEHCAVFYTAEEIEQMIVKEFTVVEKLYSMHEPRCGPVKRFLREAAFRTCPSLGDCFFLAGRKNAA